MRIAHVNVTYGSSGGSGTEQSVPNTCALLEARGHETAVLFEDPTGPPGFVPALGSHRVPDLCRPAASPSRSASESAIAILEELRPEVVHLHQVNNEKFVDAVSSRWPTLLFVHNHFLTCPSGMRMFRSDWRDCPQRGPEPACFANAYVNHCNSRRPSVVMRGMLNTLRARRFARHVLLGVDSEYMKRTLMRSGFEADRIRVSPTVTESVDAPKVLASATAPVILYVGRLTDEKGIPLLIDMLAELETPVSLKVAGVGHMLETLRRQVADLGMNEAVTFVGLADRQALASLFAEARVVAVPARYPEPFGLVGPEAMSHGRPVVGFARGGIPEWLTDGETGWLVAPEDVPAFRRRLVECLSDPETASRLGRNARAEWERRFHPRHHIDALESIYGELTAA
jgi:glycosyltransferase involved in cell wall biosynthesis